MIEESYPILKNRSFQIETVERILDSLDKKFIILDSPTGSGKTIMSLVIADFLWKKEDLITHIAVRTNEQIKRYLQDSLEKVKTLVKVFPNKRKTCPIFYKSNLSGEEIYCSDCMFRKATYPKERLFKRLRKVNYNFEKLAKIENKKMEKRNDKVRCIYHSFKKIESKIYVSTYPYVFNYYLFDLLSLEGEPDILIMDESHNLLTTLTNPLSLSFRVYLEKGFGKRKEENLLYKFLKEEIAAIGDLLNIPNEDIGIVLSEISNFSDELINFIENLLVKQFRTREINIIIERIKKEIGKKEVIIEREELLDIFDRYSKTFDELIFYWDSYKKTISKMTYKFPKKRWHLNKILKLYLSLKDPDLIWIANGFKIEGFITKFNVIIKSLMDYKNIILMSGSNFTKKDFVTLYKVPSEDVEYIKVDVKFGKKEFNIIPNFSSKYEKRKSKKNIQNLIDNIKFILNNLDGYQLYMFPSAGFMNLIFDQLSEEIKERIFLDDGTKPFNSILKTNKKAIFTYARSRFIEGVELVKDGSSLLKTVVIVGKPYPPPPTASILTNRILKDNRLDYWTFAEIMKDIQIKQVIGRAIRSQNDEVKIFFIDDRYKKSEVIKYFK
ncbi:hypothetical protein BA065_01295 [Nanoarchaeota archaeon NZ13-N]|nr:MAG: hypothetical protein BA065_01295 [Nanoarchaeota archaeon NZ13-N]